MPQPIWAHPILSYGFYSMSHSVFKFAPLPLLFALSAVFPAHAESLTDDAIYEGAKYISGQYDGNGYSVTVKANGTTQAKLQMKGATASNISSITLEGSTDLLNIIDGSSLTVTNAITNETGGVYVRDTSSITAGSIKSKDLVVNDNAARLTVSGSAEVNSFTNKGTATLGNLTASRISNSSGATLTIQNKLTILNGGSFTNNGTVYLNAGTFEFSSIDFTNSGTIKKDENNRLDKFSVKSLRNTSDLDSQEIETADYLFNGDQNTDASLTADKILVGGNLINYQNGVIIAGSITAGTGLYNDGTATINESFSSGNDEKTGLKNTGTLTINGSIGHLGKYASNSGTMTLGDSASFTDDSAAEFTNSGAMYVESGKLEAKNLMLKNAAGATLAKSAGVAKLDSMSVYWLRNESSLSVGVLSASGFVYNGEAGAQSSLAADFITTGGALINANSSTLSAGTVEAAGFSNKSSARAEVNALTVTPGATLNNTDNATLTVKERLTADWIDNASGATLTAANATVSVYRLLNEDDAAMNIGTLNMQSNVDGETGWLQLYSTGTSTIGTLSGQNIRTQIQSGSSVTHIGTLAEGSSMTIMPEDLRAEQIAIGSNQGDVAVLIASDLVDSAFNPDDLTGSMQQAADVVSIAEGSQKRDVTAQSSTILGEIHATTDESGNVVAVTESPNAYNIGLSEMASTAVLAWRAENNDMFKRLGDVRHGDSNNGLWARVMGGESKYGTQNLKNKYVTLQTGYDHRIGDQNQFIIGGAFTYTDGESTFDAGSGDNYQFGFALYGSWLGERGDYVDVIAKYSRLENEFSANGGIGSGDYKNNGVSLSVEYGKRFDIASIFYIEPQAEFTYGHLTSADYVTSAEAEVSQDAIDTRVGRLGVALGKSFERGSIHFTTSYLYDWDAETDVRMRYKGMTRTFSEDLGGHWWEFSLGGAYALADNLNVYGTVERTEGGVVEDPWQWNVGVRYVW